jgi:hypothetical protein
MTDGRSVDFLMVIDESAVKNLLDSSLHGNNGDVKITFMTQCSGPLPPNVREASPGERSERGRLLPFVKRGSGQPISSADEKYTAPGTPQVAPRQWRFFLRTLL